VSLVPLIVGWLFVGLVTLLVPWGVMRNRDGLIAMALVPMRERFRVMMAPQLLLGGLAIATALVEGIELFPARFPSAVSWALGAAFLVVVVATMRSHWRQTVDDPSPVWRLFTPVGPDERRMWVALSLAAGIGEELVWRGVLPSLVAALTGSVPAAIAISVFSFAMAHAIQGFRSMLAIASIAAAFHALVAVSGSLYVAMTVHFVYDVIAGFTYASFAKTAGRLETLAHGENLHAVAAASEKPEAIEGSTTGEDEDAR
jgi:membrane protease YdiL (CAAX protease family)